MVESAWSLLPPIITIVLALATKEVYMSLIVGIFVGALMFTGFDLLAAIDTFFDKRRLPEDRSPRSLLLY